MTDQMEFGPDNPRNWDPNAPELTSLDAPHETAAVLRMQRAGKKGVEIMKLLRMRGTALMDELRHAMDSESDAAEAGVDIYDAPIKKGTE